MSPIARCLAVLVFAPAALALARGAVLQEKNADASQSAPSQRSQAPLDAAANSGRVASERRVAARIDGERAQRRVRELVALGPRMGGTPSGDAAAEYVAEQLRACGLDVRVVDDPEKDAWQPTKWKLVARRRDSGEEFVLERAWPWTHSTPGRGKLALALEARGDAAWLTTKVARGPSATPLVIVDGATNIDGEYPVVSSLRAGATQACFGVSKPEGARLREWLAAGAEVEVEYELEAVARRARPKTVLARLRGANSAADGTWSAEHFLFCAHGDSDSGGPGADDNASGVVTLLEIAQAWSASIKAREFAPPAREVRFAIWGSEISSTREHLGARIPAEGACLGVLNYDQAGFGSGADQLNLEPDDLPANRALIECALGVLREHAPAASDKPGDFPARWATNRSLGGTDSYVFSGSEYFKSNARPALTLFSSAWGSPAEHKRTADMPGESWREREKVSVDYDAYYHSSGDTPANTTDKEPWNMAWCARIGLLTVARYVASTPAEERAK
jgi:hypothetical protein